MALSGSLVITNNTGGTIGLTQASPVNDDPTFSVNPSVPSRIENGGTIEVHMANDSVFFAPRGVGCSITFMNGDFEQGGVYLSIPAVGAHTLNGYNPPGKTVYTYAFGNPGGGNSYTASVTKA